MMLNVTLNIMINATPAINATLDAMLNALVLST